MDIEYNEAERAFRDEVRAFIADNLPEETSRRVKAFKGVTPEMMTAWQGALSKKGWLAVNWPVEHGGTGWSPIEKHIFEEECAEAGAPRILPFGLNMVAPVIIKFGTQAQKDYYLPRILNNEDWWAQGYSEPGAGSDLASLKCRAERDGDHYVVNGQKTWTSGGQWADKCFCLVRTSRADKHKGISFLLIDMHAPGVEVKPIKMISGMSPFCETFFTDVSVPKENLVGEEGQGWTIGKRLLQHERTNLSGGGALAALNSQPLGKVAEHYIGLDDDGKLADAELRVKIVDFEMRWNAFLLTARRAMEESKAAGGVSDISSILKKAGTKLGQERAELMIEIMGLRGLGWEGEGFEQKELDGTRAWLFGKATTIYGGSTEIQNNIIAKRILGMLDHQ